MQRERVAQVLMAPGYLRKLLDLFRVSSGSNAAQCIAGHGVQHRDAAAVQGTAQQEQGPGTACWC